MIAWTKKTAETFEPMGDGRGRVNKGFSLVEMLVTTLILTLVVTIMATSIPAAIDTYHKIVKTSNAQMALSTTIQVIRSEIGLATDVRVETDAVEGTQKIYYYSNGSGYWYSISNPRSPAAGESAMHGLVKQIYKGLPTESVDVTQLEPYGTGEPLIPEKAVTDRLYVRLDEGKLTQDDSGVDIALYVEDNPNIGTGNRLASVGDDESGYRILTRFVS